MNHNVTMTEILPYLYLGNRSDADNLNSLKTNGIGYILNLTTSASKYPSDSNIIVQHINIIDNVVQCLKDTFQSAFNFIDEAHNKNSKVLIHCEAGISRSPTITVAYLMYKNRLEALEAYNIVKNLRPIVSPNFGFMGQLMELEEQLIPEKVAIRLQKEAKLQQERLKLQEKKSLITKNENKEVSQTPLLNKSKNNNKPTSLNIKIINKKPNLPKLLLLNIPVLAPENKYDLPVNSIPHVILDSTNKIEIKTQENQQKTIINQQVLDDTSNLENQNNDSTHKVIQQQTANSNKNNSILKSNQSIKTSCSLNLSKKLILLNTPIKKEDSSLMPKSTSQPQLSINSIKTEVNKNLSQINIDSNNNDSYKVNLNIDPSKLNQDKSNDKTHNFEQVELNKNSQQSLSSSTNVTANNQKLINNLINLNNQSCQIDNLIDNSQACLNSTLIINKSSLKPLRPSTLFINSNVQCKSKLSAITPSALCSPLNAFAVSSTKSSPTFSNLSSPYDINEKIAKRRWLAETGTYQEFIPECKKINKQKKLKKITVEVK